MMGSTLFLITLSWICIVLAHWNNSPRIDISHPLGHIILIPSQRSLIVNKKEKCTSIALTSVLTCRNNSEYSIFPDIPFPAFYCNVFLCDIRYTAQLPVQNTPYTNERVHGNYTRKISKLPDWWSMGSSATVYQYKTNRHRQSGSTFKRLLNPEVIVPLEVCQKLWRKQNSKRNIRSQVQDKYLS